MTAVAGTSRLVEAHWIDPDCDEVEIACPVRVSLAGGGTDVLGYARKFGGSIVSLAVDRYLRLRLTRSRASRSTVGWASGSLTGGDHPLRLAAGVLAEADPCCAYDVELASQVRLGSGLGMSSALVVGILRAIERFHRSDRGADGRAAEAYRVERERLGEAGGYQDHLACAYGGLRQYRFTDLTDVRAEPVTGDTGPVVRALLLCDSEITRSSAQVLAGPLRRLASGQAATLRSLHRIRELTGEIRAAVEAGDVPRLAIGIDVGWRAKRELDPAVSSPALDALINRGLAAGALAARVLGAGGGGHVLFVVEPRWRAQVVAALAAVGRSADGVAVAPDGATVGYAGPRRPEGEGRGKDSSCRRAN